MATYLGTVTFPHKPVWLNYWAFRKNSQGSDHQLLGGGLLSQLWPRADDRGKPIRLLCQWITKAQLDDLAAMVNDYAAAPFTLKPQDDTTTYQVIFQADNPLEVTQVGGLFPDEDKQAAGAPYDRYNVVLNLIVA